MTTLTHNLDHIHHSHNTDENDIFGFWIYIMSDCVLFATLFATYIVLHTKTFGGPSMRQIFDLPYLLIETLALLVSNFTFGLAVLHSYKQQRHRVNAWLAATFILGSVFVGMELHEFASLVQAGHSWQQSAFLSAFFTLVGTHGLHVTFGLFWIAIIIIQISLQGLSPTLSKRLTYLGLFWNFLDIVWIFVFSIVYLMGAI